MWREIAVLAGWRSGKAEEGGTEISPVDGCCAGYVTATGERGLRVCATRGKGSRIWIGAGEAAWHYGASVEEKRIAAGRPAAVMFNKRSPCLPLQLSVHDPATPVECTTYRHGQSL